MATSARHEAGDRSVSASGLKRVAVLTALALLALLMLRDGLANVLRPIDPALAIRIDPTNSEVAASRAEQMLREDPAKGAQAEVLARRALRLSPVSAAGARMLATTRDLAGDTVSARRLMAYSEWLSRRDLPTQLWLIEDAVRHNDIPRALHHYDVALRSTVASRALLFPVLVKALAQPAVVDGLVVEFAMHPLWADAFLGHASVEAQDLDGLARLLTSLAYRHYPLPPTVTAEASARMVDAKRYALAWAVFAATHPGARHDALRGPDPTPAPDAQGPFGWTILNANGLYAEIRRYGSRDTLAYTAATGAGGVVARQLVLLPPGPFLLAGRTFEQGADAPSAQMRVTCVGSDQPLGSVPAGRAAFSAQFTIPAGCPAQWVELFVDGGDNPLGTSGSVGELRIVDLAKQGEPS